MKDVMFLVVCACLVVMLGFAVGCADEEAVVVQDGMAVVDAGTDAVETDATESDAVESDTIEVDAEVVADAEIVEDIETVTDAAEVD